MASNQYDIQLSTPLNGVLAPYVGYWVQLVSNNTGTAYVSTAKTDGTGKATFSPKPPGDTYVINVSLVSNTGPWSAFGVSNHGVPVVQGESPSFQGETVQVIGPFMYQLLRREAHVMPVRFRQAARRRWYKKVQRRLMDQARGSLPVRRLARFKASTRLPGSPATSPIGRPPEYPNLRSAGWG
jgi:hypothetical protein